ncbi:MAG: MazG-like family protein [Patescibacteria group bacterium]
MKKEKDSSIIDKKIKVIFQKSCRKIQEIVFRNKKSKGFNIKNVPFEFCLIYGELAEAFDAWQKKEEGLKEELADVAIYLFGLASILKIDLGKEIIKKIEKNKKRKYLKVKGVFIKETS